MRKPRTKIVGMMSGRPEIDTAIRRVFSENQVTLSLHATWYHAVPEIFTTLREREYEMVITLIPVLKNTVDGRRTTLCYHLERSDQAMSGQSISIASDGIFSAQQADDLALSLFRSLEGSNAVPPQ